MTTASRAVVECSNPFDELAAEEDRERDRAVPEVVAPEGRSLRRPPGLTPSDTVEAGEPCGDPLQQIRRVDAVVVGKRDRVSLQQSERGIPRTGEAARGLHPFRPQRRVLCQDLRDAIVL